MVLVLRPQADAGAVGEPETSALGLLGRHLQPLTAPDPLDKLVVHEPARITQQRADLAVAVAPVLAGELDEVGRQGRLVVAAPRHLALRRAVLAERPTGAALGDVPDVRDRLDASAPARGAQKFPRDASCRMSLSSVRSAMALRSRWFSTSRSFMRRT